MSSLRRVVSRLVEGGALSAEEAGDALREIVSGGSSDALVAAFLTAMRMRGEGVEELYGMAGAMRELCVKVEIPDPRSALDIVGTGGDAFKTFNVSTVSSLVVAATGVGVAKHGNRAATGVCGSADLLEDLGVNINMGPQEVRRCYEACGFGFMFAPLYHPAMRNVAHVRRELGFRTFFNLLGPVTNPAGVGKMLLGVAEPGYLEGVASVLARLGLERCLVVSSRAGVDEVSVEGETDAVWVEGGDVWREVIRPSDFGLEPSSLAAVAVKTRGDAIDAALSVLMGVLDHRDPRVVMVLLNSAAALVVAGACSTFREGVRVARDAIYDGRAYDALVKVIEASGGDASRLERLARRFG